MTPFVVIADDLSGAGDAGVQFAKRGVATEVVLDLDAPLDERTTVVVYDTDSRMLAAGDAAGRIARILARSGLPPSRIFKKIDSTLRGPIGAEIAAALDALPGALAFVAPAYPANRRTTRDGEQYVAGRRVHETQHGRDPKTPVTTSEIARILDAPATIVPLAIVRAGAAPTRALVDAGRADGHRRFIFDAESEDDLRSVAALASVYPEALWAGSAGILGVLEPDLPPASPPPGGLRSTTPLLVVAGSLSETTREQLDRFGAAGALVVDLTTAHVAAEPFGETVTRDVVSAAEAFRSGRSVAIVIGADDADDAGRDARAVRLATRLGILAAELVADLDPSAIFLTGGDIARATCTALGITHFTVVDELEPGIPLSRAGRRMIITKAGGFGSPDAIVRIDGRLRGALVS